MQGLKISFTFILVTSLAVSGSHLRSTSLSSRLFVSLTLSKILALDIKNKYIYFVLFSFIRIFVGWNKTENHETELFTHFSPFVTEHDC